ncbi:hypothetical protein EDD15DRAFT_2519554 [Pisolithus albus]|nr:hypothetical protein EDD15DRAFT_2519554 [Pisolithus albus]
MRTRNKIDHEKETEMATQLGGDIVRRWLGGGSKRSQGGSKGFEGLLKVLEGAQHHLDVLRGGPKVFRGASKVDRGRFESLERESKVDWGSGFGGEAGLEPRQATGFGCLPSRVWEVLAGGRLALEGEGGALELERGSWVVSESTRGKVRGQSIWPSSKGPRIQSSSEARYELQTSQRARICPSRPQKKQKEYLRGCTRCLNASRMRGDGSLEPTYSRRGNNPLDALERDSKEAGGVFDVEVEASRSRNEVPWGGSRGEGGFDRVTRGEEGFEEAFEGLSRRDARFEGGNEGSLGRGY